MGRKSAVEKLPDSAKQIIYQEKADEASYRDIAEKLNDIYQSDISHESVRNWWNNHSDDVRAGMTEDNLGRLKEEEMKDIIDSASQLKKIHNKINQAIDELDPTDRQDMGHLKQMLSESRKQLKFQKNLVEDVTGKTEIDNVENMQVQNNNMTAVEINQEFNQYIRDLEEDGVIEIRKPEKLQV